MYQMRLVKLCGSAPAVHGHPSLKVALETACPVLGEAMLTKQYTNEKERADRQHFKCAARL